MLHITTGHALTTDKYKRPALTISIENNSGTASGKRAFVATLEQFPELAEPTLVLLDFTGVDFATSSYLSEVLVPLRDHLRLRRQAGYAVAANLSEKVREEIEEMLRRSGDAFLTCATDASSLPQSCTSVIWPDDRPFV